MSRDPKIRRLFILWTAIGLVCLVIAFLAAFNIPATLGVFAVAFFGWAICFGIAWWINFNVRRKNNQP